jgi:hypothetical protein
MTKKLIILLEKVETEYDKPKLLNDIPAIIGELKTIFTCIKQTKDFGDAQPYFEFLMNVVCIPLERMWFVHNLNVGEEVKKFINDFDRIDDLQTRKELYKEIKDGTYTLNPEDEKVSTNA